MRRHPSQRAVLGRLPLVLGLTALGLGLAPWSAWSQDEVVISERTGLLDGWPCMDCHDSVERTTGPFTFKPPHQRLEVDHMAGAEICATCHDTVDMDRLVLITGESISLAEPHRLCGQCHGEKKRDWDVGVHRNQVGSWAGVAHRYTCTDCHDAHVPTVPTLAAAPPPPFPRMGIPKGGH